MVPGRTNHQRQTKTLLGIGFGGLLLLMCVLSASSLSFLYQIEIRHERLRQDYVRRDGLLERLHAAIYVSGTYFRDFLVERDPERAAHGRERFLAAQSEILAGTDEYGRISGDGERKPFQDFRTEVKGYFGTLTPALEWSEAARRARANALIQDRLLPRRAMAINAADRLQQVNERELEVNSQAVSGMFASFRTRLLALFALTMLIGAALAAATMWKLLEVERVSERRYREAAAAREELKQLSAELLAAQETERRRISRELHDEVGQVLSAMMLGLGNMRSWLSRGGDAESGLRQVSLIEDMTERSARVVRNLSLALRPTMLDDLGLIAALKWLAREMTRSSSMQVEVMAEEAPDELPEEHRTCVYRVVQEAIRNAARHAGAQHARISVSRSESGHGHNGQKRMALRVTVRDDGKGFDPEMEKGMGVLGMEERVERLGGTFEVKSEAGRGTQIAIELPLPEPVGQEWAVGGDHETSPFRTA